MTLTQIVVDAPVSRFEALYWSCIKDGFKPSKHSGFTEEFIFQCAAQVMSGYLKPPFLWTDISSRSGYLTSSWQASNKGTVNPVWNWIVASKISCAVRISQKACGFLTRTSKTLIVDIKWASHKTLLCERLPPQVKYGIFDWPRETCGFRENVSGMIL